MDGGRQQDRWKYRSWDRGLFQGDVYEGITDKSVAALDNSVVNCVLHPVSPNEEGGVARFSRNNGISSELVYSKQFVGFNRKKVWEIIFVLEEQCKFLKLR